LLPEKFMTLIVSAPMSFVMTVRATPPGNVSEMFASPTAGTPPLDQLPALLQLPFTAPLHV
jgi:hypothetical protein